MNRPKFSTLEVEDIKARFDMIAYAERFTELRGPRSERFGPCPQCGGEKRFHVTEDWFFCRDCHEKRGDAIELVQWVENCTFAEAMTIMGAVLPAGPITRRQPAKTKVAKVQAVEWSTAAAIDLAQAQQALRGKVGAAARAYLAKRGILPATWAAYGLGCGEVGLPGTWNEDIKKRSHSKQMAIFIPWYAAGQLVGLRYRFLCKHDYPDVDGRERSEKQGGKFESQFGGHFFGAPAQGIPGLRTLIICEGELNAMSIAQVAGHAGVDVLSIGSETQPLTSAMIEQAQAYRHRLLWTDKPEVLTKILADIHPAQGLASPGGKDANDLLQAGELGGIITASRFKLCRTPEDKAALYFDLWDAHHLHGGLDEYSATIMERLRPTIAKVSSAPVLTARDELVDIPTIQYATAKPALPADLWLEGLPLAKALKAHSHFRRDYFCTLGKGETGYFVR